MTLRSASAEAAKSRRCSAWRPRSYMATASWYVGFRGGGAGGGGGGGGGGAALTGFGAGLGAGFAFARDGAFRDGFAEPAEPRRADWPRDDALRAFRAARAGLRLEVVRALIARRNFAMPGG